MPAEELQALQRRDVIDGLTRAADIEGEVAEHAVAGALDLVGQRLGADGQRLGVGHLEHGRDPARDRGAAAGLQVLLLLQARLAEMHLGVDDARQHVEVGGIDDLGGAGACQPADGGDAPLADADVALAAAVVTDDRAAFDEDVEGFGHRMTPRAACAVSRARIPNMTKAAGRQHRDLTCRALPICLNVAPLP